MSYDKAGKVVFIDLPKSMQGKHAAVKVAIVAVIAVASVGMAGWWIGRKFRGN